MYFNMNDYVELSAFGGFLIIGLALINPVSIGVLVGVSIGYGIYRLSAGEQADIWINKHFGYKP
jgi:hypothetical protein